MFDVLSCVVFVLLSLSWMLGAMLTLKCDSMFCERRTEYAPRLMLVAAFVWPVIAILLLTTKHDTSLGGEKMFDY